jgi:hypothetical protein
MKPIPPAIRHGPAVPIFDEFEKGPLLKYPGGPEMRISKYTAIMQVQ